MNDIYQTITDKIIAELEAGTAPWVRPWSGEADPFPLALRFLHRSERIVDNQTCSAAPHDRAANTYRVVGAARLRSPLPLRL